MFTWICPQCGREVPPSYNECPDCAAKAKAAAPPPGPPAVEPQPTAPPPPLPPPAPAPQQYQPPPQQPYPPQPYPPQQYAPPQQQYPPQQPYPPQYQQQYQAPPQSYYAPPPPPRAGMPTWLMSILCAVAFGGIVLGAYYLIGNSKKAPAAAAQDSPLSLENPPAAGARINPILKQVEVVGLRLTQNKAKKTEVRFLLVNHSAAEIPDISGSVTLEARTRKKDEEPVGSFAFKTAALGPYEAKEMTELVNTKLKVYELPDWQNLQAQIEFAPQ